MGHVRNYVIGDICARYHKLKGDEVIHPMGWDAFGLPAENAAMQYKTHPKDWTISNIENMKAQLKKLDLDLDWDRELATCNDEAIINTNKNYLLIFTKLDWLIKKIR